MASPTPTATATAATPSVKVNPDPNALPGSPQLQQLIDGLAFWVLLAVLAGALIGAAVWALGSPSNNHHWAARGRTGTLVSLVCAAAIGAAAPMINFFVDLGRQVH